MNKNVVEEISRLILVILVAILLLQIVTKNNGMGWIKSFFQNTGTANNTENQGIFMQSGNIGVGSQIAGSVLQKQVPQAITSAENLANSSVKK